MSFNIQSWGRISSSSNNDIVTLQDGSFAGSPNVFTYVSATDTVATISAANYFNNVVVELNVGDFIYAVGSDTTIFLTVATLVVQPAAVTTATGVVTGDVSGPASSTDNALARFDGVTGKIIQNSVAILSDAGALSALTQLTVDNVDVNGNTITAIGDLNLQTTTTGVVNVLATASSGIEMRLFEDTDNGTNYVGLKAANNIAANVTYTLPAAPTVDGYVLSSTTAGTTTWVSNGAGSWVDQTTTPVTIAAGRSYSANNAGLVTLNMPASAAFGDKFEIAGNGAGGWLLQMNTGQSANDSSGSTTVAGTVASTTRYDCVTLVCTVANTTFTLLSSMGALTLS